MRVLLFEERAHLPVGHYPNWVAELARELSADGHEVHVLTRHGWLPGRPVDHAAATYRMPRRHRVASWLGTEIRRQSWLRLGKRRGRPLAYLGDSLRHVAVAAAVRHRLRRIDDVARTVVVVLSTTSPLECAIVAPARARWLVYTHASPARTSGAWHFSWVIDLIGRRERRRRRRGGFVRLVANNTPLGEAWREAVPWVTYDVISSAGRPRVDPAPKLEARAALGLPADGPIALCFGVAHGGKDVETVLLAFAGDDAPAHLVLAGAETGRIFAMLKAARPHLTFPAVTIFDGYVSDEQMFLLHSAADFAVLSFHPDWPNDSGTIGDAVGHGLPVCSSDTSDLGRLVREHRLGEVYAPGDVASLRAAAARTAGTTVDRAGQAAYLAEFSPQVLARRLLSAAAP